jgi:hypothetical protein
MVPNNKNLKYFGQNYFFKLQKIALKFIGFWPGDEQTSKRQKALTIFNAFFILAAVGFEFYFAYVNLDNLGFV